MVRARAPLRLGLAGGGTDLLSYSIQHGGAVLNVTIDRYAFASIRARDDGNVHFDACDLGREEIFAAATRLPESRLLLHRGVYERMVRDFNGGAPLPISVTTAVDAPMGSGLGSFVGFGGGVDRGVSHVSRSARWRDTMWRIWAYEIERVDLGLAGGPAGSVFRGIRRHQFSGISARRAK